MYGIYSISALSYLSVFYQKIVEILPLILNFLELFIFDDVLYPNFGGMFQFFRCHAKNSKMREQITVQNPKAIICIYLKLDK